MFDRKAYMKEYSKKYRLTHPRKHYSEQAARYRKAHPKETALANRKAKLKREYGMTLADYDKMFAEQKGLCKICGDDSLNKRLAVDHDHQTGEVRGLLCGSCNTKLGWYETLRNNITRYLDG